MFTTVVESFCITPACEEEFLVFYGGVITYSTGGNDEIPTSSASPSKTLSHKLHSQPWVPPLPPTLAIVLSYIRGRY